MASIPVRGRTTVFTAPTLENRIMKDRTMAAPHMPPVYDHQGVEPIPSEDMDMSVPVKIHSARRNTMPVRNEMNDARTGEPTFLPRAVFTGDCTRAIIPERMPKTARITRSMSVLPPLMSAFPSFPSLFSEYVPGGMAPEDVPMKSFNDLGM